MTSIAELKQARSSAKAAVTKARTELESALSGGTVDKSSEVNKLKDKLDQFKKTHSDYLESITDGEETERENLYYNEVITSAQQLLDKVLTSSQPTESTAPTRDSVAVLKAKKRLLQRKYQLDQEERQLAHQRELLKLETELVEAGEEIDPEEPKAVPTTSSEAGSTIMLEQQKQLMDLLTAPKLEIPQFNGSPMQYFPFIKAFEDNVERVVPDHASRLTRLLQYCTGSAKHLIQCCAMMPSSEGYLRARELLRDRFGNPFTVTTAFIERVTAGSTIKDTGLRTYSDELRNGYEMLKAMNCLAEINVQSNLLKIVCRLPNYIQNRWRREATRIKRERGQLPCFLDIVNLVEEAAEEANDPVFGSASRSSAKNQQAPSSSQFVSNRPKNASSFNSYTAPAERTMKCFFCSEPHSIYACTKFKGLRTSERIKAAQDKKLCANCLRAHHTVNACRSERTCRVCSQKHHTLLHPEATISSNGYVNGAGNNRIALPVVAVKVRVPGTNRAVQTYALLDGGSTNSFVSRSLMNKLSIQGERREIILTTLEKSGSSSWTSACALTVSDVYDTHTVHIPLAFSRDSLPIREENIATADDLSAWPHLKGIDLPRAHASEVELLIGQDSPECIVPQTVISGKSNEPYAIRTKLGWTLNGPVSSERSGSVHATSTFVSLSLEEQVERFWRIDSSEIHSSKAEMSVEDRAVVDLWDKSIKRVDDHYQLPIPFKNKSVLMNNKEMAESRLKSLKRKFKDPNTRQQYTEGINDLLENGYAEEVVHANSAEHVWYLPHHPVVNPNKPKLRIVFDCAAKFQGVSLNDCVLQGPDLMNKLVGVLLRFRQNRVAFMADIKTMFYQVKVPSTDRDCLRFLWWPDGNIEHEPRTYRMTVHPFGGCWSPSCCAYALQQAAENTECSEQTKRAIKEGFYVDDCLYATPDLDSAQNLATELRTVLAQSGFTLTKWTSNSRDFIAQIPHEDQAPSVRDLNMEALPVERALGVIWDTECDVLTFRISKPMKPATKRGILSVLSSVYDPLGLISPFILNARRIVQELFRRNAGWDETIPADLLKQWESWTQQVCALEKFQVPRCILPEETGELHKELHYFSDASETAHGVVVYLRVTQPHGGIHTQLLMAKSRLAPLKGMTIPRLELTAAALAARVDEQLREELRLPRDCCYFWTDSTIVLGYIKNESKRYKTFVSNRVMQIRELTNVDRWNHVPTHLNPADDCSRGKTADELLHDVRWRHGPNFLSEPRAQWMNYDPEFPIEDSDPELKPDITALHTAVTSAHPVDKLVAALSSWKTIKRAAAWLLLVKDVLLKKCKPRKDLQPGDLQRAECEIVKHCQRSIPSDKKTTKILQSLNATTDNDGILRARGRIANAPIPEHARCPIILPRSRVAELIILEKHCRNGHTGREFTLSLVMERYWVFGARRIIKSVLNNCVLCSKIRQAPMQQQMANLPEDRVTPGDHAFANVGCDYFGPFHVKRGRGREKRYGCIFTCLTTRAIHLEIAPSLDTSSFLNSLTRFIARRGKPDLIRSDNGTNFVSADHELKEAVRRLDSTVLRNKLADDGIRWIFNPPAASHMGGAWERQIRSVRKIMAGLTHEQVLTDDALHTLLCSVEAIINNRPLTTVSTDPNDLTPLTPNHLLILRPAKALPGEFRDADLYCRNRWRQVQYLADVFWTRWIKEYVPHLQRRSKWLWSKKNLETGDVVLVIDNNAPRNCWRLGRVLEPIKGSDGKVRSARIRTKDTELVRPISKLCRLETNVEQEEDSNEKRANTRPETEE